MSLALVFLARGIGDGLVSAKDFFDAYHAFPSGCPHELVVAAKGWPDLNDYNGLRVLVAPHATRLVDLPDDGFDWGAYMRLALQLPHTWLCFLNTHSRPRVAGWLHFLKTAAQTPGMNIGVVGATGSWETLAPILPPLSAKANYNTPLISSLRVIRNTVRFGMNIRNFHSFPNPHLRSNAFIIRRELFIDFVATQTIPSRKWDGAIIESGRTGFSAYLSHRGLKALVAGADGRYYESGQWIDSQTFRVPGQKNLLVEDNQTIAYNRGNQRLKRSLERATWGRVFTKEGIQ